MSCQCDYMAGTNPDCPMHGLSNKAEEARIREAREVITALDSFRGEDAPKRVQSNIEMRLNAGWLVESTFVYKDGESGVETIYVIYSRRGR